MLVGLDVLRRGRNHPARRRLTDAKIALLTHNAAVDEYGKSALSVFDSIGLAPAVVFSPEHGLDGVAQAEEPVGSDDANVGERRLISLYGASKETLSPRAEDLEGIDVLVIDLVDIGTRYYTYVWTALLAARAAANAGVHTLVLDRPNPLSGNPDRIEGRPQDAELCSFVGLHSIPVRHSMTLGEILISQFNAEERALGRDGAISVVPVEGWERHRTASAWGRPFVPPSPNMPTLQTALVYPGGCLLEGTNLSEGRGTTLPFQQIGAPYLADGALAAELGEIPGAWIRACRFKPSFDKHQGQVCSGIMLHVSDESRFSALATYLKIIAATRKLSGEQFQFLTRVYEFESEHPAFDLLTGTPRVRNMLLEGAAIEDVVALACGVEDEWVARVETAEELMLEVTA